MRMPVFLRALVAEIRSSPGNPGTWITPMTVRFTSALAMRDATEVAGRVLMLRL